MDQQFRQIQFSCAIKCNTSMLITTNAPNQLIDINIPSIISGGMVVNGMKFGQYGGKQNLKNFGRILEMQVSTDG